MKAIPLIDIIYFVLLFACFVICLLKRQNLYSIRFIVILLGVMILVQVYAEYLNLNDKNNLYLYHILTPVEYAILAVVFAKNMLSAFIRKILLYSIPVFILLAFIFSKIEGTAVNNSYASSLEGIILTLVSLVSLREIMLISTHFKINKSSFFWFTTGVLFYCIGNLLISAMLNYLIVENLTVARLLYQISYIFSCQFFILLIIAAYMSEPNRS